MSPPHDRRKPLPQPPRQPDPLDRLLQPLRRRSIVTLTDERLVVRTFDGSGIRLFSYFVAAIFLGAGLSSGEVVNTAGSISACLIVLVVFELATRVMERQQVTIEGDMLEHRTIVHTDPPLDLRTVAAACYLVPVQGAPAMQLLNPTHGGNRRFGSQRWQGVTPAPRGPNGERLRCYAFQLGRGAGHDALLVRLAPVLLSPDVVTDENTEAWINSRLHPIAREPGK